MRTPRKVHGIAACAILLLTACAATPPPPTDAITAAETSLRHAEQARVGDESAVELREARSKLKAARTTAISFQEYDMVTARKLADEARFEADLAAAKSETVRQQLANREVRRSVEVMRFETQRTYSNGPYSRGDNP